jgi:hypothetical protein
LCESKNFPSENYNNPYKLNTNPLLKIIFITIIHAAHFVCHLSYCFNQYLLN